AAIETHIAVAPEQCLVRERRNVSDRRYHAALARNDAVNPEPRLRAVDARMTAADLQHRLTECPHHELACVQADRILPGHPLDRLTSDVEAQHAGCSFEIGQRREHGSLSVPRSGTVSCTSVRDA